jgi:hypothetical protein
MKVCDLVRHSRDTGNQETIPSTVIRTSHSTFSMLPQVKYGAGYEAAWLLLHIEPSLVMSSFLEKELIIRKDL